MLIDWLGKQTLVIIMDTKDEYHHYPELADLQQLDAPKGVVRVKEVVWNDQIISDMFLITEFFSDICFHRGNCVLVVEEIGDVIPKGGRLYDRAPKYARLLQQGMGRGCGVVSVSQRPQEMHTTILSQSTHVICFNLFSPHDQKAVESFVEPELFDGLGKYEFFHIDFNAREYRHCYKLYAKQLPRSLEYYRNSFGKEM
jgi:hypothetical protein